MGLFKKLMFWKRKRHDKTPINVSTSVDVIMVDAYVSTNAPPQTADASTMTSTQTDTRVHAGAPRLQWAGALEKDRKIRELEKQLENLCQTRTLEVERMIDLQQDHRRLILKMRFMRDKLLWYMEQLDTQGHPPTTPDVLCEIGCKRRLEW